MRPHRLLTLVCAVALGCTTGTGEGTSSPGSSAGKSDSTGRSDDSVGHVEFMTVVPDFGREVRIIGTDPEGKIVIEASLQRTNTVDLEQQLALYGGDEPVELDIRFDPTKRVFGWPRLPELEPVNEDIARQYMDYVTTSDELEGMRELAKAIYNDLTVCEHAALNCAEWQEAPYRASIGHALFGVAICNWAEYCSGEGP